MEGRREERRKEGKCFCGPIWELASIYIVKNMHLEFQIMT
jgi:hypothetical protein